MLLHRRTTPALAASTLAIFAMAGCGSVASTSAQPVAATTTVSTSTTMPAAPASAANDPSVAAAWRALMGRDGEYAAIAAYTAVIDRYGDKEPYVSILSAEQRHAAALTRQLSRRGVQAPANPYLGTIAAPTSLKAAAKAEVTGEIANVKLYDRLLTQVTDDPQLTRVFTNLRRASLQSHLPAFRKAAAGDGTLSAREIPRAQAGGDPRGRGRMGRMAA